MVSLSLPAHAGMQLAYLTPEEMLLQDQVQYYGSDGTPLPINPRRAEQIVDQQAQQNLSTALGGSSSARFTTAIPPSQAAADLPPELDLHLQGDVASPMEGAAPDPQVLRLLERLQDRESAMVASVAQPQPTPSHGLFHSGPEAVVSVGVMLLAVAVTMLWARRTRGWKA